MIDALRARITGAWRVLIGAVATEAISFPRRGATSAAARTAIEGGSSWRRSPAAAAWPPSGARATSRAAPPWR